MNRTVSIIMPAYNEGECIFSNIKTTHEVMRDAGLNAEIVVIDDGSDDNTLAEIERAAETFENVVATRNPYNMGKGMALRTGFDHSTGDIIVFLDADLDLHPSQINNLIEEIENGPYDVVVTSKHHPESRLSYPFKRKVVSYCYYMIIKFLFNLPVRDTQTGLKIFRRKVLDDVFHRLLVKAYAYDVELLATAVRFGYRVHEIPVVLDFKREMVWGRLRFRDIMSIFTDTLAIFYRLKILRYYDTERPPMLRDEKNVLVVSLGAIPTEQVIKRLSIDTNTLIACIVEKYDDEYKSFVSLVDADILCFSGFEVFKKWLSREGRGIEIIGFLGSDCIPVGSWVKNALRNFQDSNIKAVCGPVVAGLCSSMRGRVSSMLYSSILTSGPNSYLYSIRRIKITQKGFMDNLFISADLLKDTGALREKLYNGDSYIFYAATEERSLKYDPDVAVARPVPPLFLPYLKRVAKEAFDDGNNLVNRLVKNNRLWTITPMVVWLMVLLGWTIPLSDIYRVFIGIYMVVILILGLSNFFLSSLPIFVVGMLLDHVIRAVAVPAGFIRRLVRIIKNLF